MKRNFARVLALIVGIVTSLMGIAPAVATTQPGVTRGFYSSLIQGSELIGTELTEIQILHNLPAGRYLANAAMVIISDDPEHRFVDCFFTIDGAQRGDPASGKVGGGPNTSISMALTLGFILRSPHDLGLACASDVSGTVFSQPSTISVIRVDTLRVEGFRIIEP